MDRTLLIAITIAAISATVGFLINQKTGTTQAILTIPMTAWILFQFRTPEKIWTSLGNFQNPVLFAINGFTASFIYHSWKATPLSATINISLGIFLITGALSLLIYNFWNIGG